MDNLLKIKIVPCERFPEGTVLSLSREVLDGDVAFFKSAHITPEGVLIPDHTRIRLQCPLSAGQNEASAIATPYQDVTSWT